MYDRDPRAAWEPGMADVYGWQPWTMLDLTPVELDLGEQYLRARKTRAEQPLG